VCLPEARRNARRRCQCAQITGETEDLSSRWRHGGKPWHGAGHGFGKRESTHPKKSASIRVIRVRFWFGWWFCLAVYSGGTSSPPHSAADDNDEDVQPAGALGVSLLYKGGEGALSA